MLWGCLVVSPAFALPIEIFTETSKQVAQPVPVVNMVPDVTTVVYGDFSIRSSHPAPVPLGDGEEEAFFWTFDFSADADTGAFLSGLSDPSFELLSAMLVLHLSPRNEAIDTDLVGIDYGGLPNIATPAIQGLRKLPPVDDLTIKCTSLFDRNCTYFEVSLNLLDFYSAGDFISALTSSGSAALDMIYHDDAIVSYASMSIVADIPLPGSVPMLGAGLLVLGLCRRRQGLVFSGCRRPVN